ncbi:hypothetical protein SAMN05880593_108159 [Rhizobium sp. RU36D]|nr:hypothetical protein SAMN05880593_108159 [Rhizobium sp. RU36D]
MPVYPGSLFCFPAGKVKQKGLLFHGSGENTE